MIVNRRIWGFKKGCGLEAAALIQKEYIAEKERGGYYGPIRLYFRETDACDLVSLEYEYADVDACTNMWTEWSSRPTSPAFFEKWNALRDELEISEIWTIPD